MHEPPPLIALVADLIFGSKISATAVHLGVAVRIVRSAAALIEAVTGAAAVAPSRVLLDLSVEGLDGPALVRDLKQRAPGVVVVAFLPHVEVELAKQARAAGADQVLARAAFVKQLPEILRELSKAESPVSPRRAGAGDAEGEQTGGE